MRTLTICDAKTKKRLARVSFSGACIIQADKGKRVHCQAIIGPDHDLHASWTIEDIDGVILSEPQKFR